MAKAGVEIMRFGKTDPKVAQVLQPKSESRYCRLCQADLFYSCVRSCQNDCGSIESEVVALLDLGLEYAHKCSGIQQKAVGRAGDGSLDFDVSLGCYP
jgi:hypothetical protein